MDGENSTAWKRNMNMDKGKKVSTVMIIVQAIIAVAWAFLPATAGRFAAGVAIGMGLVNTIAYHLTMYGKGE